MGKKNKGGGSGKSKVLSNYKKVGTKFIPPLKHQLNFSSSAGYSRQTLPELIWWDVLAHQESHQFSINVAEEIAAHFKDRDKANTWWAFISDYRSLSDSEIEQLKNHLSSKGHLEKFTRALDNFLRLYPSCPLVRFRDAPPSNGIDIQYLEEFEARFFELESKRSRLGVLMQANAIYMGFVLGKLKVKRGLALADFPEVSKYPETERSKEVGASICATLNAIATQMLPPYEEDDWVLYFWQRNLTFRPIDLNHLEDPNE